MRFQSIILQYIDIDMIILLAFHNLNVIMDRDFDTRYCHITQYIGIPLKLFRQHDENAYLHRPNLELHDFQFLFFSK